MCVGLPMRVVEGGSTTALCERRGERTRIDTLLVGAVAPGDWLLAYQGSAVRVLSADEAAATDAALAALEAVLAGADDVSRHFADLVDRTPELPAHLRGGK
jgi:hydrogenase expression/formation protein HypC